FSSRGYAIDTLNHRFSPELKAGTEPPVEEWIDLAVRGEWATLDKVHRLLGSSSTVVSFRGGLRAARQAQRVANGQASAEVLLALKRSPLGQSVLEQNRERVWPLVREAVANNAALCEAFAHLLHEHATELEQRTAEALRSLPPGDWQPSWRLL